MAIGLQRKAVHHQQRPEYNGGLPQRHVARVCPTKCHSSSSGKHLLNYQESNVTVMPCFKLPSFFLFTLVLAGISHKSAESSGIAAPESAILPAKIPHSLQEVDNGQILGFGADLSEDHPGFRDTAYKQRRKSLCDLARHHVVGQPIPTVEYTPEEANVWSTVMRELEPLYEKHACAGYLRTYPLFRFSPDAVPQLEDLRQTLERTSGWTIRPTAGLLHPRDFLAGLAFKCFHSTQYMRHPSKPMYTPEPDIVHEALGHVPMLADPAFCDLVHHIGVASLGADDKTIWKLTKIYWYTTEFGVVWEHGEIKAFGAGVLSSYGELENMASGAAEIEPFDPFAKLPGMSYKDGYQKRYFALESFETGAARLREYCDHLQKQMPRELRTEVDRVMAGINP